ncbi:MAG: hypothetical protein IKH88_17315 [Prevotella sp.]|nr:hypothetical protein [Prevotella sp.]
MKKTRKILLTTLWGALLVALLVILVYETSIIDQGALAGNAKAEFVTAVILELSALMLIPLVFWLFKWKKVREDMERRKEGALLTWGLLRLLMLCIPMMASILAYYLFVNPTFYYLALILAICLFFVYPSADRCAREMETAKTKE